MTYTRETWERLGWTVLEVPDSTSCVLTTRGACAHVERIATGRDVCYVVKYGGTDYDLSVECYARVLASHTAQRWALHLRALATPTCEPPLACAWSAEDATVRAGALAALERVRARRGAR